MCGITAIFSETPDADLFAKTRRSIELIAHRGPDGEGVLVGNREGLVQQGAGTWSLGHVRLAILDLSAAGAQPMANAAGNVWVTYNGEVYNYLELAEQLQQRGHQFRSRSDTEVLLAAYEEWGDECVSRFRGMFSFVLVALRRRRANQV